MFRFLIVVLAVASFSEAGKLLGSHLDGKIVGGKDANIEDFPYQISYFVEGDYQCGGSIIDDYWVLTASHCLETARAEDIIVYAGRSSLDTKVTQYSVEEVIKHENYDKVTVDYDIALLKLSSPFEYGNNVQKVNLAESGNEPADGSMAVATGWGYTTEGGEMSQTLQSVELPVVGHDKCQEFHTTTEITSRILCAGYAEGGKDTCQGDSGGPLVLDGVQIGVVSWGYGCARPNSPGFFANVAFFRDWIKEHTGV